MEPSQYFKLWFFFNVFSLLLCFLITDRVCKIEGIGEIVQDNLMLIFPPSKTLSSLRFPLTWVCRWPFHLSPGLSSAPGTDSMVRGGVSSVKSTRAVPAEISFSLGSLPVASTSGGATARDLLRELFLLFHSQLSARISDSRS